MNRWCSPNRPVNASINAGIFGRIRGCTSSASATGSCSPSINASSIARLDTPVILDTTDVSLTPASSRSFSSRCASRLRSRVITLRARVRSRS
jgi:hypothetical protein